ncbi:MAG TPA: SDR family NAD(P)-dependent oxidoreductase [Solirubrobacteraceae bacterium]|nr:SDR family NAD(P)-dependent oxidoreductase [Solirubrobacteraceae bacterium]
MAFIALITGASSGIGEATARRLARGVGGDEVKLILVARRRDRLDSLAQELGGATVVAVDLTTAEAAQTVRGAIEREHGGQLNLLVNNAGAAWRGSFADTGWANIDRHMRLNFEAPVRLTEELLPLLRATASRASAAPGIKAPVSIVNVASTAGRVSRPRSAAYSASKFALIGWSDGLYHEEREHGVHVGLVVPGFVRTEGFPAAELPKLVVSDPPIVADAIYETGPGGKPERYVPRWYWIPAALRIIAPGLLRRALARNDFATATATKSDA